MADPAPLSTNALLLIARAELAGRLHALDLALECGGIDAEVSTGAPNIERQLALATVRARASEMTVRQQTHEIVALRLHVYVVQDHLDALGVEVTRADVEADALARGLSVEPAEVWTRVCNMAGREVVQLQFEGVTRPYLRSRKWRESAVLDYANAIATEFGIAALDVLDALADRVEAGQ